MEEARTVRALAPGLGAEQVTRMVTEDGAGALGVGDAFGALAPGRHADLALFRCADVSRDPYEAFVGGAGRATLVSVISAGRWRVRDGSLLAALPPDADRALAEGRDAAREALRPLA
ncbi:MAG TPA: amidohydrolase family protein, partial [Coriobacteriia bacterium]|nr:amidohydrolase family protein [Coriobacteriia bacterium]